jgi:hypothetical protein
MPGIAGDELLDWLHEAGRISFGRLDMAWGLVKESGRGRLVDVYK